MKIKCSISRLNLRKIETFKKSTHKKVDGAVSKEVMREVAKILSKKS